MVNTRRSSSASSDGRQPWRRAAPPVEGPLDPLPPLGDQHGATRSVKRGRGSTEARRVREGTDHPRAHEDNVRAGGSGKVNVLPGGSGGGRAGKNGLQG